MRLGVALLCLLSAARVAAAAAPSDHRADAAAPNEIEEIVVTGGREVTRPESAQTVHEITAEEIKKSSARTLDEALVLLSDVNVRMGAEGVPRVDIRGFRTRHVLLLLDGIPMNSAFDQQFDPSSIPVDNIAKIKVTAGASSVLFGQGGLGGVINIITKKGSGSLSGVVGAESGDGQPILARASASGAQGKWDYLASASGYRRDRFPLASPFAASLEEGDGYRKNSDSTRYNAFFNVGLSPNPDLYLALTGNVVRGGYGKPASAINDTFDDFASTPKFGRVDYFDGYTFQLAADWTASAALSLRAAAYYNRIDQDDNQYDHDAFSSSYTTFDDPIVANTFQLRNVGVTRGFSLQPKYRLGRAGTITLGLSGEWDTWTDSGRVKTGDHGPSQGGHDIGGSGYPHILFPVSDHEDLSIVSAAIEYEVAPIEKLGLTVGFAQHWQHRKEQNARDWAVSATCAYDLHPGTRLKSAFQRNIRFPSLSQLYLRDADNPDLLTERVYHYQLGVEQKLPWKSSVSVDGFHSDAHNFISLDENVPTGTPAKNRNYSLYRFYGVEAEVETRALPRLVVKAGYTYLRSRDYSDSGMQELQYVPRDRATFAARYDFDFGLTPFASVVYCANTYVYTKKNVVPMRKATMTDYAVINLKVTQKVLKEKLLLYAGADNLLNLEYEQSYGIPRPGRFVFGGAEYRW
jgi:outer membrane cobalamin receptor